MEGYQTANLLFLAAGAGLYLVGQRRWQRILALVVPVLLSQVFMSLGLYHTYPLEPWANPANASARRWMALQPLGNPLPILLLLPRLILRLPWSGGRGRPFRQRPKNPQRRAKKHPLLKFGIRMFSIKDRDRLRDRVLHLADSDARVVAGAVVGSLALSEGDRWSDLDLSFAVTDEFSIYEVLEDWTRNMVKEFDAAHLFDLPSGASIYRVFLLPGCLQFDLSFTPASQFGAAGPKFKLLFGSAVEKPYPQLPPAQDLFGYAVHHALRARFCIERGRYWHAEYWISAARDYALSLACRRRGLPAVHGRGFDDLPTELLEAFNGTLVLSLEREELLRALGCVINGLLAEAEEVKELASKVEPQLRTLTIPWDSIAGSNL